MKTKKKTLETWDVLLDQEIARLANDPEALRDLYDTLSTYDDAIEALLGSSAKRGRRK
jgi:hypothetical protein